MATARLPGGYWDDAGVRHRDVLLRPLSGRDEEQLAGAGDRPPAARVTMVLARCLVRLGPLEPVPAEVVRQLLVGDRDHLLLQLRALTFGPRVHADLVCPWAGCGRPVSVSFDVSDIPVQEAVEPAATHRLVTSDGSTVTFRLPTGGDQEAIAHWAEGDELGALDALLHRCVLAVERTGEPGDVDGLGPRARAEIEAEMERLAPAVERTVETRCAECGRSFLAPLDVQRFFFGDLRTDSALLYREVHQLAYHYHWTEPDIMTMALPKRQVFLDLLADELDGADHGR